VPFLTRSLQIAESRHATRTSWRDTLRNCHRRVRRLPGSGRRSIVLPAAPCLRLAHRQSDSTPRRRRSAHSMRRAGAMSPPS
jgi:hypothetical protein